MALFSQRKSLKPLKKEIQIDSMDDKLRNRLWNVLKKNLWDLFPSNIEVSYRNTPNTLDSNEELKFLCEKIWDELFGCSLDSMPTKCHDVFFGIKKYFFNCEWNEVYDFIEFVVNNYPCFPEMELIIEQCNIVFEEESSAYRFVENEIVQITDEVEIEEIEEALNNKYTQVNGHIKKALYNLSDREHRDYKNSIKESISAVEAICSKITGENTLGKALNKIEKYIYIHPALKEGFDKIYGYTSNESGIRHGMIDDNEVGFDEAKFMLVACSAFVNYLKMKESNITSQLTPPPSQ